MKIQVNGAMPIHNACSSKADKGLIQLTGIFSHEEHNFQDQLTTETLENNSKTKKML